MSKPDLRTRFWMEAYLTALGEGIGAYAKQLADAAVRDLAACQSQPAASLREQEAPIRDALRDIAEWRLPSTGLFWDDEQTRPVSYEAEYGSNGARDYIQNIARCALAFFDAQRLGREKENGNG